MSTKILGEKKKGVSSTLFDPRLNHNKNNVLQESNIKNLQSTLAKKDNRIGFAHVIDMMSTLSLEKKSTKYGEFYIGFHFHINLLFLMQILKSSRVLSHTPYQLIKEMWNGLMLTFLRHVFLKPIVAFLLIGVF